MTIPSDHSPFAPQHQVTDLESRIVVLLERIAEVFKAALWEEGKHHQLSPLQIQVLVFLCYHASPQRTVSYLAQEFNVSKPTISEVVRILEQKKLLERQFSELDGRSHTLTLTSSGHTVVKQAQHFATPILKQVNAATSIDKPALYHSLLVLLQAFQKNGLIGEVRMCLNCPHLSMGQDSSMDYACRLLGQSLSIQELRIDCPEFNA